MKPEQDDRLEVGGDLGSPRELFLEKPSPPEIVRQVNNPVLEAVRRLWWRAIDRVCGFLSSFGCRSLTGLMDQSHRHPPTWSARPITSGWSGPFQWQVRLSSQQNAMPGRIER
jgi:hypothetical protein